MERAGFVDLELVPLAPAWYRSRKAPYAVAAVGSKPAPGRSPGAGAAPAAERARAPMTPVRRLQFAARFVAGSLAGALFVPVGAALHARQRLQERRGT
jgi:MPBQ/MSBQ methyltransferase